MPQIVDVNTSFGVHPAETNDWSLAKLLEVLERNGVHKALAYSLRGVYYDFTGGNDETWEACRRHEVLEPVATIDPRRHIGCLSEAAERAKQGFRAFRFFPQEQGWTIDSLPFINIMGALAEFPVAVMLPVGEAGQATMIGEKLNEFGLPTILIGAGYNTAAETMAVMAEYDNIYCDLHMIDCPGMIETMAQAAGAQKLLFGSHAPQRYFEAAHWMARECDLTADEKAAVLGLNASELLGLEVG